MATDGTTTQSQADLDHAAAREALAARDRIARLGSLAGVKSIFRNLKSEDKAVERNIYAMERAQLGAENFDAAQQATSSSSEDDEMEVLAGGDVTMNIYTNSNNPASTSAPSSASPPENTAAPTADPQTSVVTPQTPTADPQTATPQLDIQDLINRLLDKVQNTGQTTTNVTTQSSDPVPTTGESPQVSLPTWVKAAIIGCCLSGPLGILGTYLLQPSAPPQNQYGFQVLPGIHATQEGTQNQR